MMFIVLCFTLQHVQKSLNPESANYITSIVALGHLAYLCPDAFATGMKNIVTKVVVKDLLMQDRVSSVGYNCSVSSQQVEQS